MLAGGLVVLLRLEENRPGRKGSTTILQLLQQPRALVDVG